MSDEPQQPWFFSKDGKQHGPVTMEELRFLAANAQLHPRQDLLWTQGMDEWKPAGEIEGLFEKVVVPEVPVEAPPAPNFREEGREENSDELMGRHQEWPGVARGGYFFGNIALGLLSAFLPGFLAPMMGGHDGALIGVQVVLLIGGLILTLGRLGNLGMSRWWILGWLVPLLNIWVGVRLFAYPPGYTFHRKLDGIGIFLAVIYWLAVLTPFVILALIFFTSLGDQNLRDSISDGVRSLQSQVPGRP